VTRLDDRRAARCRGPEVVRPIIACLRDPQLVDEGVRLDRCPRAGVERELDDPFQLPDVAGPPIARQDHPRLFDAADIFDGVAGVGLAALARADANADSEWLAAARWCGDELLARARARGAGLCWPAPDGKVYYGDARGASGVALCLVYLYLATREERWLVAGRRALAFDLAAVQEDDAVFLWPYGEDASPVRLPYLEFGAGVGAVVLRYDLIAPSGAYQRVLERIAADVSHKYAAYPGYLMGLAAVGQFLIDLAVLGGDERAWWHAERVAEGVRLFALETPSGWAFPSEHHYRLSCDFGTGAAGVLLFLHNLQHRRTAPFMLDRLLAAAMPPRGAAVVTPSAARRPD
jgi:hypothetical protein